LRKEFYWGLSTIMVFKTTSYILLSLFIYYGENGNAKMLPFFKESG